jgi:hypothetical protein
LRVDADDLLIKAADFSLTSACPMNGLVTARSALRPQAGQIAVGGNTISANGVDGVLCPCTNMASAALSLKKRYVCFEASPATLASEPKKKRVQLRKEWSLLSS